MVVTKHNVLSCVGISLLLDSIVISISNDKTLNQR